MFPPLRMRTTGSVKAKSPLSGKVELGYQQQQQQQQQQEDSQAVFESIDLETLKMYGMASLPLIHEEPKSINVNSNIANSPLLNGNRGQSAFSSPMMGYASPIIPAASPRDLFRPMVQQQQVLNSPKVNDVEISAHINIDNEHTPFEGGKSRTPSLNTTSTANAIKKKKPYEPTGTRSSRPLLDASAPTMTKNYAAPGKTTRKIIPVGFQKKLKLNGVEGGDLSTSTANDSTDIASADLLNEIDQKRRKNCVAARESRRRKLEFQNGLKDEIKGWRSWAGEVEELLRGMGREDLVDMMPERPEEMSLEE